MVSVMVMIFFAVYTVILSNIEFSFLEYKTRNKPDPKLACPQRALFSERGVSGKNKRLGNDERIAHIADKLKFFDQL